MEQVVSIFTTMLVLVQFIGQAAGLLLYRYQRRKLPPEAEAPYEGSWRMPLFPLPVLVQVVSNPWHLLGLNLYNVANATASSRWQTVKTQLPMTIAARMIRIVPAFSIGGSLNRQLRSSSTSSASDG